MDLLRRFLIRTIRENQNELRRSEALRDQLALMVWELIEALRVGNSD